MAWALSQIWVISGVETQQSSWMVAYHKLLSQDAFANYRTLMKDMTLNPGMGNYLDMARSTKGNPNENYPREVMQLFTVGLFMLNQDGTQQKDGQGNPIPTYDQNTVNNFTKVFTGFSFCNTSCANSAPGSCQLQGSDDPQSNESRCNGKNASLISGSSERKHSDEREWRNRARYGTG